MTLVHYDGTAAFTGTIQVVGRVHTTKGYARTEGKRQMFFRRPFSVAALRSTRLREACSLRDSRLLP